MVGCWRRWSWCWRWSLTIQRHGEIKRTRPPRRSSLNFWTGPSCVTGVGVGSDAPSTAMSPSCFLSKLLMTTLAYRSPSRNFSMSGGHSHARHRGREVPPGSDTPAREALQYQGKKCWQKDCLARQSVFKGTLALDIVSGLCRKKILTVPKTCRHDILEREKSTLPK